MYSLHRFENIIFFIIIRPMLHQDTEYLLLQEQSRFKVFRWAISNMLLLIFNGINKSVFKCLKTEVCNPKTSFLFVSEARTMHVSFIRYTRQKSTAPC